MDTKENEQPAAEVKVDQAEEEVKEVEEMVAEMVAEVEMKKVKEESEVEEVSDEKKTEADEYKVEGNTFFKDKKYRLALELYTQAIETNGTNAVFYSNRAFCHLKLESYGAAIEDSTKSITLNKKYIKGYYRRGAAYMAMGKYKDAQKNFQKVLKMFPKEKDAKMKVKQCKKAIKQQAFAAAISSDRKPPSETTRWQDVEVPADYDGPKYDDEEISLEFVNELIDHFQSRKNLHMKYVYRLILEIIDLLKTLPVMLEIPIPKGEHITVCGDVHGQFYDLLNLWELNGRPSEKNPYLYNGDFVDRGSFSLEIMLTFFAMKLLYPKHFHMTRGNHESRTMNEIYGFKGEVVAKVGGPAFELFSEAFNWLPLCARIHEKILVVHGGLFSKDGVTLDDIRQIDRNRQPPDSGLMCEMLWSDPQPMPGRAPSKRGVGLAFGPDVTKRFLEDNGLELLIRSHEVKMEGYEVEADGHLITIFSAPNYCDSMGNKGAFIRFEEDLKPQFTSFGHVPHPPIQPMAYANPMYRV